MNVGKIFTQMLALLVTSLPLRNCLTESGLDRTSPGVNVILQKGDVMLAGYFGVHSRNVSSPNHCGRLIDNHGIVLAEAMRYVVDSINNKSLLFGHKLGYRIIDACKNTATLRRSLFYTLRSAFYMGIVGPTTSDEAILAAVVHSAYKTAVVSNSASSTVFEDRNTYYNFFRTIPSDALQIKALADLAHFFNWTYVSTVNSYGTYGQRGMDDLVYELEKDNYCIGKRINLPDVATDSTYQQTISELLSVDKAKVVILFTTQRDTRGLLQAAKDVKTLTWVSSTSWYADVNVIKGVEGSANGSLILQYADTFSSDFMNHFTSMTLKSNNYTWFREFWGEMFNCSTDFRSWGKTPCSGSENLKTSSFFGSYYPVKPVLAAVESIACALRKAMLKRCPSGNNTCINPILSYTYYFEEDVAKNLKDGNSSCNNFANSINLNSEGYYQRDFTVLNFDGTMYKEVGFWRHNEKSKEGYLQMKVANIRWKHNELPVSVCSLPCKKGEVHGSSDNVCCFTCRECGHNAVVRNGSCFSCGEYERANEDRLLCIKLPSTFIDMKSLPGSITIVGSLVGIILNTVFLVIFTKHRESRIVKASSRELSFIIILSLYICFTSPYILLTRPSQIVCGLQRFIIGLSLTGCYTPLMLKTSRIYRIFKASQTMISKPVLVGSRSQILICMGLIGIQLLLGIMWVVGDPPTVVKQHIKYGTEVAVICKFDAFNVILNLIPCFVLMAICTIFAFKTRKFPSNFNEAYSIGITMYISCFLWGIFIPLLLLLQLNKENVFAVTYVISSFTIIIGIFTLLGLFGPKLKKLVTNKNVAPAQELFSEFTSDKKKDLTDTVPVRNPLATISEQGSVAEPKIVSLARLRSSTKDVSTNT